MMCFLGRAWQTARWFWIGGRYIKKQKHQRAILSITMYSCIQYRDVNGIERSETKNMLEQLLEERHERAKALWARDAAAADEQITE